MNTQPRFCVRWVPSTPEAVENMLELASPNRGDILIDLGCGDGRIVIKAAQKYGCYGIGVDLDPNRIREAKTDAARAFMEYRTEFYCQDLFTRDVSMANVITMYLQPRATEELVLRFMRTLTPGTKIVSNTWGSDYLRPTKSSPNYKSKSGIGGGVKSFLWVVPERSQ